VSGVFPAGTKQVTVVFYGDHPSTNIKALHLDDLLLRVDNRPNPPRITGMTTPNYAASGETDVTVTLTGVNLPSGQTSVTLRAPGVMVNDYVGWADAGRKLIGGGSGQNSAAFGAYTFTPGDKFVVTSGPNVILGEYEIAQKDDDRVITLVGDITGPKTGDEQDKITGYIVKAPLAATSVSADGTQVTATFNLAGQPAGYRDIVVEVAGYDPIVWREGFNVINPGPNLINPSFELPEAPEQDCQFTRVELPYSPASDWTLRFWNNYEKPANASPLLNFRDDYWAGQPFPSCPPPERGGHYASTAVYSARGTAQWSQTLAARPGTKYRLSGYFGHSGEYGTHGTKVTLFLLDGDSAAAPIASTVVLSQPLFEDWTFASVTGKITGDVLTVAWEVECFGDSDGPRAVWVDHLVLEADICHEAVFDSDGDGDVDQDDFAFFQTCITGSATTIASLPEYCACLDTNSDEYIDGSDLAIFAQCASGPELPADPLCGR